MRLPLGVVIDAWGLRYGFKAGHFQSREPRIVKLPALNLSKLLTPVKTPPTSPAGPKDEVKTIPEPVEGPKESERIAKWQRMMKVAKRDIGGNVEKWTFDERKGKKVCRPVSNVQFVRLSRTISCENECTKAFRTDGEPQHGSQLSTPPQPHWYPLPVRHPFPHLPPPPPLLTPEGTPDVCHGKR